MTDDLNALADKLRALLDEWGDDTARTAFAKHAAALSPETRQRLALLVFGDSDPRGATLAASIVARDSIHGAVNVGDSARIYGPTVGINLGKIIYGRDPREDERRQLVWYLQTLAAKFYRLPLRGLDETLDRGDGLAMPRVYVALATTAKHLAVEAVAAQPRLVLLGEPGSGKSTFLRHLAWALAQCVLDPERGQALLPEYDHARPQLPILLPLRTLAERLDRDGLGDQVVFAALAAALREYGGDQGEALLRDSLHSGGALLLFDGLDEVPLAAIRGTTADRATVVQALRSFCLAYQAAPAVVTCRTRAFDTLFRDTLGWPVEMLARFTRAQMRDFAEAWYAELAAGGQIEPAQAGRLAGALIGVVKDSPKLSAMAGTPLLLTMMALVLYNKGELPRDRPQLYEQVLELLLGQWDKLREGQSLADAIGLPDWDSKRVRPLLDQLSYQAHLKASSRDGRGRLARGAVRDALEAFFLDAGLHADNAAAAAVRCLDYFNQRSGLLVPDDARDSYVFVHLTLQEHCAGRYIVLGPDAAELVLHYRADDRWREPIFLGLGVAQQYNPTLIDRVLSDLIDRQEQGTDKSVVRWWRDLLLANEIGQDRDWGYLRALRINVDRLQRDLKRGLVALLQDKSQPLPVAERVRIGFLLGDLGDPRFPTTIEQWRAEIRRALTGDPNGYFCRVEPGTYIIGSTDDDPDAQDNEKPQHTVTFDAPFFIARYPIANAQWQTWVQAGGREPYLASNTEINRPNQPVVDVTWDMCNDFCRWLSEQTGTTLRLPTEYEWEAAARGGDARRYPWGSDWQDDRAATTEDQVAHGQQYTVPIGCYPAGAAPCGALDMAGNVWEWVADEWRSYPGAEKPFTESWLRVLRGGAYGGGSTSVRCGARLWRYPNGRRDHGFRVVLALRLAR